MELELELEHDDDDVGLADGGSSLQIGQGLSRSSTSTVHTD